MKSLLQLRRGVLLGAIVLCAGLPACLVVHENTTTVSGRKIAPATFAQVEPGKSQAFVLGLLGEPTSKVKVDGGGERWQWHYAETKKNNSGFIFVFMNKDETKFETTCSVELADGVVTRAWTE